jgi:uncharacterized membrane protein YczE
MTNLVLERTRFSKTFALLHFAFLLGVLAGKPSELYSYPASKESEFTMSSWSAAGVDMIGARSFHLSYEHPLVQALMFLDIPTLLLTGVLILWPLSYFVHPVVTSYAAAVVWLLVGTGQWYLIGRSIDRWRDNRRARRAV